MYVKCHQISDLIHSASMYVRVPEENYWYNLDQEKVEQQEEQEEQQEQQDQQQQESDIESSEMDTSMDSGMSGAGGEWYWHAIHANLRWF